MSERKRKSTKKTTKKRSTPREGASVERVHIAKKGFRKATIKRLMKRGGGDLRISENAVESAKKLVQSAIRDIGGDCSNYLTLTDTKTVTKELLQFAVKKSNPFGCKRRLVDAINAAAPGRKHERDVRGVGVSTAVHVFGKSIPLKTEGKNGFNIERVARYALAALADAMIMALAHKAHQIALASKKKTITSRFIQCSVATCD